MKYPLFIFSITDITKSILQTVYYSFNVELNHLSGPYKADTITVLPVGTSNAYFKRKEKTYNVLGKSCNSRLSYESVYRHQ